MVGAAHFVLERIRFALLVLAVIIALKLALIVGGGALLRALT